MRRHGMGRRWMGRCMRTICTDRAKGPLASPPRHQKRLRLMTRKLTVTRTNNSYSDPLMSSVVSAFALRVTLHPLHAEAEPIVCIALSAAYHTRHTTHATITITLTNLENQTGGSATRIARPLVCQSLFLLSYCYKYNET